ncbi:unnamed protein product [Phytophthora fragariaefolia]|uniref:Unnamed protein product n=1 Tax=Phytophthora fragariaefolia TaxID=1490495 RepID=A0A9W6XWL5_9STRA|nr:unnamed protein product [Phytophthora fragariaefolia]
MKLWHKATKVANLVDKLLKWVQTIDFTIPMPIPCQVHEQPELMSKANTIPLLSRKQNTLVRHNAGLRYEKRCIYDPMKSSYTVRVPALAESLIVQLPDYAPRKYRVHHYQTDLGIQVDSFNCGVYVLLAFEVFAGAQGLCMLGREELQYDISACALSYPS